MTITAHFLVFLHYVHASQNIPSSPIWVSFCPVFARILVNASIRDLPNRSVPICTHPHHFLTHPPKHDVRGNFPDHSTQILTCETLNDPCLYCFCAPRVPCVPAHLSAPIHTHLHHFLPIRTLFLYCMYVNLIEK